MSAARGTLAPAALALALTAALAAESARAQQDGFRIDDRTALTGGALGIDRDECLADEDLRLELRISGLTQPTYLLRYVQYPIDGLLAPCPEDMLEPVTVIRDFESIEPIGGLIDIDETIATSELVGAACPADATEATLVGARDDVTFCYQLVVFANDTEAVRVGGVGLEFDTELPPVPEVDDVRASDTSITITVAEPAGVDDVFTYLAQYRTCDAGAGEGEGEGGEGEGEGGEGEGEGGEGEGEDGLEVPSLCGATGTFREATSENDGVIEIGNLKEAQEIEWRVLLIDDFGNEGPATELELATTLDVAGALDVYDGAGSDVSCDPSCGDTASSSSTATGLGALLFGLSRRGRRALRGVRARVARGGGFGGGFGGARRGALWALWVLVAGGAWADAARADFGQATVSLQAGPYTPALDTEAKGGGRVFPMYGCVFEGKELLEFGGAVDTHLFDGFGSLQLTVGFDAAQAQGKAQDAAVLDTGECGAATDVDVQMTMLKVRPGITYRLDPLLDLWSVPLVPYGRVGLVGIGYAFTKEGELDDDSSTNPVGARFGWEAAGGLMLALDFLDSIDPFVPDTTRRGRANETFDHTFIYVEAVYQPLDSFGTPGFIFSPDDRFLDTRLPVLWKVGIAVELL